MDSPSVHPLIATVQTLRKGPWFQYRFPWQFEITRATLPVPHLPPSLAGLRILHLTDLHFRAGWAEPFDELIQRTVADPPDLILFTGDLVEHHFDPRPAFASAGRLVSALQSRFGKFAILGNHDGDLLGPMWLGWGVLLITGVHRLTIRGAGVELVGLPGVHREDITPGFVHRLPPREPDVLRIVMSHYPDTLRMMDPLRPDLVLAGHTHGGQVCLPGGIPILTHDRLPRFLCRGIHRTHAPLPETWLVVGQGFGFSTWPVRTFCPAEVIELELRIADFGLRNAD